MINEKRPRHYAATIAELPRSEWRDAVLKVPEHYREMVRSHLRAHLEFRKHGITK